MALAQGANARVTLKPYASGVMSSNSQPNSYSDLGVSGGQILRRVSSTLKLAKDTYTSSEINSHLQITDFRHGVKRVTGGIVSGEFSPGTYWDLFEAALRGTAAAAVSAGNAELTSLAASASASTLTCGGGNPVDEGFRVGSIVRATNLSETANNSKNFLIAGFSGASNRTIAVYPAPTDMGADTSFTLAEVGQSVIAPASGLVQRKFAIEHYFSDASLARLFTEVRVEGFNWQCPSTGLSMVDFTGMGRDMEVYDGTDAPFFTGPTAETSTGLGAAVNGVLYFQGSRVGICTGFNVQVALQASSEPVVGQNYVPDVFLTRINVTGQATVLLEDATFMNYHKNETEVSLLAMLTSNSDDDSPAASVYLPRIKLGDADVPLQGEAGLIQTCPFQALKYATAGDGIEATTIRLHDTQAS